MAHPHAGRAVALPLALGLGQEAAGEEQVERFETGGDEERHGEAEVHEQPAEHRAPDEADAEHDAVERVSLLTTRHVERSADPGGGVAA